MNFMCGAIAVVYATKLWNWKVDMSGLPHWFVIVMVCLCGTSLLSAVLADLLECIVKRDVDFKE
jgi:CDP-diglyceride synthetase